MAKLSIKNFNWKAFFGVVITIILGMAVGAGVDLAVRPTKDGDVIVEANQAIELSKTQVPAEVEVAQNEVETKDLPTVEQVDGGAIPTQLENMSAEERDKAAQGFAIDISTPWTVVASLDNQCIYMGNPYGSQCVNTTNVIAENQVGYWMSTCGTGAARGIWDCREENARGGYELITDPTQLRPGDLLVTWGGDWGHTGMVVGYYNNGYVPVFSTNQGGAYCSGGGAAANTINLSMATFSGAFRWHGWDYLFEQPKPTPEPVIPITGCYEWYVERGDTMGKIMYECEGFLQYGEVMNVYADSWYSRIIKPGQSVYEGWKSPEGVGLYETDWIDHKVGE